MRAVHSSFHGDGEGQTLNRDVESQTQASLPVDVMTALMFNAGFPWLILLLRLFSFLLHLLQA